MGKKAVVGDVFLIPLDETRFGIGQLAGDYKGELYIVVYDQVVTAEASVAALDHAMLEFAALTLDAKLYHGDWRIIGNRMDVIPSLPQPWFKVGCNGQIYVESRDRSYFRPANSSEADMLQFRTVVAPIRLENALKAVHGIGPWQAHFDDLHARYAIETDNLLGQRPSLAGRAS